MKRSMARMIVIQCLYQIEMNEVSWQQALATVEEEVQQDNETQIEGRHSPAMFQYAATMLEALCPLLPQLNEQLAPYLQGWQIERLSRVDRLVLLCALYELRHRDDIPPRVVLSEAVMTAKRFGTDVSGKFVNGVLSKLYADYASLRTTEPPTSQTDKP
jgi:N utilization substance protein B